MARQDPRIRTALLSLNPTTKRPAWHGAPTVLGVLRGVTADVAIWRAKPSMNNIREIALHAAFWNNSIANRLTGESHRVKFAQRKTSWPRRIDQLDEAQWRDEVALVASTHERLVAAVSAFDPSALDRPVGGRTTRIAIEFIHGIAEHNLYHAAQIKLMKLLATR